MALEIAYTDDYGVLHPAAYVRILAVHDFYGDNGRLVEVGVYHDAAARHAGKKPFLHTHRLTSLPGDPRATAYTTLRTLAPYSNGADV